MKNILSIITFFLLVVAAGGCEKFVEVPSPPEAVPAEKIFSSDVKATAALNGIYSYMMNPAPSWSSWMTTVYAGASSDELVRFNASGTDEQFFTNQLLATNDANNRTWLTLYRVVYLANVVYEGADKSGVLTPAVKNQVKAEALFLRAFAHFILVNLYGDVPLELSSDYQVNKVMARTEVARVYESLINDLEEASGLLPVIYPSSGRGRPNKWTAKALLSRVYLYQGAWEKAASAATEVLQSNLYTPLPALNNVFLANSTEAIWQLVPDINRLGYIPEFLDAGYYPSPAPQWYLRPGYVNVFEAGDQRRFAWVDSVDYAGTRYYYPAKYRDLNFSNAEYYMVFRAGEQFLNRAEARVHLNDATGALQDLNTIRARAGLPELNGLTGSALLEAIQKERRLELFAEWGHRWLDLKRWQLADKILPGIKGPAWKPEDALWPIPQTEIIANPALSQNPGY
jgi:hypothetical protein